MNILNIGVWGDSETNLHLHAVDLDEEEEQQQVAGDSSSNFTQKYLKGSGKKDVMFFGFDRDMRGSGASSSENDQKNVNSFIKNEIENTRGYEIRHDLNSIVGVWMGAITAVACDAIVVPVTQNLQTTGSVYDRVIDQGGPELIQRFTQMEWCSTGDAGICQATDRMNCGSVIFASAPKFMSKRKSEALNVMGECYLRICELAFQHRCRTIVIPVVQPRGKKFPEKMAVSCITKAVRSFIERQPEALDKVIICVDNQKRYNTMSNAFGWIFPRSEMEGQRGKKGFEKYSEKERKRRTLQRRNSADDIFAPEAPKSLIGGSERLVRTGHGNTVRDRFGLMHEPFQTHRTYKPNQQWVGSDTLLPPEEIPFKNAYTRQLNRALRHNLGDMEVNQFLYKTGKDHLNRQVVIWVASRFPAELYLKSGQMNRVLMYIIRKLHTLVEKDYIIIYFHGKSTDQNIPPISWITSLFHLFNHRYAKCLRGFYFVHPNALLKTTVWFLSTASFWEKVMYINSLEQLINEYKFDPKMISIPGRIWEYDRDLHGDVWMGLPPPRIHARVVYEPLGLDYDINQNRTTTSEQIMETVISVGSSVGSWLYRAKEVASQSLFSNPNSTG